MRLQTATALQKCFYYYYYYHHHYHYYNNLPLVTSHCSAWVLVLSPCFSLYISSYSISFYVYYILHVLCILHVTLCECHGEIKYYLLAFYLLTTTNTSSNT